MGTRWIHLMIQRKWWVVIAWAMIVLGTLPLAIRVTHHLSSSGFDNPNSPAVWATKQLNHLRPPKSPSPILISQISTKAIRQLGVKVHIPASDFHPMKSDQTVFLPSSGVTLQQSQALTGTLQKHHATVASIGQIAIGKKVANDSSKTLGTSGILAMPFLAALLLLVFGSLAAISLPPLSGIGRIRSSPSGGYHHRDPYHPISVFD